MAFGAFVHSPQRPSARCASKGSRVQASATMISSKPPLKSRKARNTGFIKPNAHRRSISTVLPTSRHVDMGVKLGDGSDYGL